MPDAVPAWVDNAMAIDGATSPFELLTLGNLLKTSSYTRVLEVGHWWGRSTAAILQTISPDAAFVSIDHHLGDNIIGPSRSEEFTSNVAPYENGQDVTYIFDDFATVLPTLAPFDFVFYDGDHSPAANRKFWECAPLTQDCTLVMDDADWEGQLVLQVLAWKDGFKDITPYPIVRSSKSAMKCATFCIMRRSS